METEEQEEVVSKKQETYLQETGVSINVKQFKFLIDDSILC